jgi:tetraacyldisaccharide 4'-kinase
VIALAKLLHRHGWSVDVLSRGYGRTGTSVERVDLDVDGAARRFGDEPTVIAQRTGAEVWVAVERYEAGTTAEAAESASNQSQRVHLLDDGFQHWRLARAVDVVLVTEEDLDDALLPAGNLREPLVVLGRADVVVLREDECERVETRVRPLLHAGAKVWTLRRELRFPDSLVGLEARVRPLAFCAIARPNSFYAMLRAADFDLAATVDFPDHHAYTLADMERITTMAKECGATGFVVTEKDAVKLSAPAAGLDSGAGFNFASGSLIERLQAVGPVCVVVLEAKFVDEADVMRGLEARLR